jgi:hypothetical protein
MRLISGARPHLINLLGSDKIQEQLRTLSTFKMTPQFERKYSTQGSGALCHVSFGFFSGFCGIILPELQINPNQSLRLNLRLGGYSKWSVILQSHFHINFSFKTTRVLLKTFEGRTRGRLGTTREGFRITQGSAKVPSSLGMLQIFLRTFGL